MKSSKSLFVTALLITACCAVSAAGDDTPSVKASISRKRILVGDRIRYKIEIFSRLELETDLARFKDNKLGECEIKDYGKEVAGSFPGARRDYINWFDFTSYYIGKRTIHAVEIKYREKGESNWKTFKTREMAFTVESVLPRNMRLYDIKDIKGPKYPFSLLRLLGWIAAPLAVLWLLSKLIKKLKRRPPPKTPFEIAMEAIDSARADFAKTSDAKEYYVRISDAIRRYIETVFKVKAPEMTTQEFLSGLGTSWKVSEDYKELLKNFLETCDLVKFARHAPSKDEADAALAAAKRFLEGTKIEDVRI